MSERSIGILEATLLLLLFLLSWGLLVLLGISGAMREFIHPLVYSRALGTTIVLTILAAWRLASAARNVAASEANGVTPLLKIIPLVLLIVLVPPALRSPGADPAQLELKLNRGGQVQTAVTTTPDNRTSPGSGDLAAAVEAINRETLGPDVRSEVTDDLVQETGPIVLGEGNYSRIVDLLWDDPVRFTGRTVEMVSFAFRRSEWPSRFFTAARLSIWCCVADAAVIGLLVETDQQNIPVEGEWIRIRGELSMIDTFDTGTVTMTDVPVLREVTWEPVPAPSFEYVFPANW